MIFNTIIFKLFHTPITKFYYYYYYLEFQFFPLFVYLYNLYDKTKCLQRTLLGMPKYQIQ